VRSRYVSFSEVRKVNLDQHRRHVGFLGEILDHRKTCKPFFTRLTNKIISRPSLTMYA